MFCKLQQRSPVARFVQLILPSVQGVRDKYPPTAYMTGTSRGSE